ncbi:MAG TPA: homoserine kinase [Chloroflexia bacterium]|nr:homoserine kinase [Chloroflexia bacterium]
MAVKTQISETALAEILAGYALGEYKNSAPITHGSVQTNYLLETGKGKFVFRYYENRAKESVLFESNLIHYLKEKNYPCPAPIKNRHGKYVGDYNRKPYLVFEFIEGQHLEEPDENQREQLIEKVAQLHRITRHYRPRYWQFRWNYNVELCRELARAAASRLNTDNARQKLKWHEQELLKLRLPAALPKGICHCDFHFSNVLFENGQFKALLDFDDANYTYLMFDLVGLIETEAWRYGVDEVLNFAEAEKIVRLYSKYRPLNRLEKRHLFDLYRFSILIDCLWYFDRGEPADFYEKRKIDFLESVGREGFYAKIFS